MLDTRSNRLGGIGCSIRYREPVYKATFSEYLPARHQGLRVALHDVIICLVNTTFGIVCILTIVSSLASKAESLANAWTSHMGFNDQVQLWGHYA